MTIVDSMPIWIIIFFPFVVIANGFKEKETDDKKHESNLLFAELAAKKSFNRFCWANFFFAGNQTFVRTDCVFVRTNRVERTRKASAPKVKVKRKENWAATATKKGRRNRKKATRPVLPFFSPHELSWIFMDFSLSRFRALWVGPSDWGPPFENWGRRDYLIA